MSEQKFEQCSLEESTHFAINRVVHEINDNVYYSFNGNRVGIRLREEDVFIPEDAFPFLGINPLREIKPEPVVFEATFVKYDGKWHPLYSLDDGLSYQNSKKARFKCVEILEDEE